VVFYNRSKVEDAGMPARQVDMAEAMAADFVVVAVPGGKATHHLINANTLAHTQKSGIFVNISRGDVVDESALIDALQKGRIAGAGLDVYEFEPQVPAAFLALENVTLLPHLGTACLEVREGMGMMAVANLIAFADGKAPPNLVNP
jgi:lactate dehydrogenase-like 2-hydroxyacid dehydrogenase